MKIKRSVFLFGMGLVLLAGSIWAGGMMSSGGGTMMGGGTGSGMGGGMMTGDAMTRLMMQDLGNRQMMGQGMQETLRMGMQDMENMQQNQAKEKMKDSMENGMPGEARSMSDFHLIQAAQCDKSAGVAQAIMDYDEQMKAGYQAMMGQTSDKTRLEAYQNMIGQYHTMAEEASKLKKDYEKMARWHRSQTEIESSENRGKNPTEGSAETVQSMITYHEQMKKDYQKMMDQMPQGAPSETVKDMMKHYDAIISEATQLKENYGEMAKWPKTDSEKQGGTNKESPEGESK